MSSTGKFVVPESLFIPWCFESKFWALGAQLPLRLLRLGFPAGTFPATCQEAWKSVEPWLKAELVDLQLWKPWCPCGYNLPYTSILNKAGTCVWALFSNHLDCLIVDKIPGIDLVQKNCSFLVRIWARFRNHIRPGNRECGGHCGGWEIVVEEREFGFINTQHAKVLGLKAREWLFKSLV